jgi:hypothetical protein
LSCDRQFEVALVEHLCSYFLAAHASEPVQLVFVPLPREASGLPDSRSPEAHSVVGSVIRAGHLAAG